MWSICPQWVLGIQIVKKNNKVDKQIDKKKEEKEGGRRDTLNARAGSSWWDDSEVAIRLT